MKRRNISVIALLPLFILLEAPFARAADRYSVATGNWNSTSTWSATSGGSAGASVPVAGDNVYIERTDTVTIAANAACATITIGTANGAGTLTFMGADSISYTLTVSGNISIASNSYFTVTNVIGYNYQHTLNIGGNLTVDGTFNVTTTHDDGAATVFNGSSQQTISGSGTTCTFEVLTISNTNSAGVVLGRNIVLATSGYAVTNSDLTVSANDVFDLSSYTANRATGGSGTLTVNAGATLKIGGTGTFPANYTTNTLNASSTVTYNGTTQTVRAQTYGNLTLSGSGVKTLAGTTSVNGNFTLGGTATYTTGAALSIGGNLSVGDGTTFTVAGYALTVTGTTTIGNGTSGTLTISSATGTKAFNGDVTVSAGATWNNTAANVALTLPGSISNSGTFNAGTGIYTLSGTTKTITGTLTIPSVTVTGTYQNNGTLTVSTALAGSGTLTNGASGTLNIGATAANLTLTTLTATASGNTVNYNLSGDQTVKATTYYNLTLSGSGTKTLAGSETVSGTLTVSAGTLADGGFTLSVNGNIANSASHTGAGKILLTGGSTTHTLSGGGSYTNLELNDANGATLGSDLTINGTLTFTSGKITLGSNTLTIASGASISGGSSSSYVVANSTGVLTRNGVGATNVIFPVGTSSTYNPVTINNAGTSDNFSVRVQSSFDNAPNDPNSVVNCQWTITEATAGGSNATITLQWNTADEAGGFVRTNPIYIGRYTGSQWVQTAATFTDLGSGVYTASAGGFTSFSPFGVGSNGALPIQMVSSTASVVRGNDVEITWKTVSETNNYGFEIYRKRIEGSEWTNIGFVEGHGTSLAPHDYAYFDRSVGFGEYSYRIKQIDLDGKSETFPEMEVTVGVAPGTFLLVQNYPNPFNPTTTIAYTLPVDANVDLQVYDISGRSVAQLVGGRVNAGYHRVVFSASGFASGVYFYRLTAKGDDGTEFASTRKMLFLR